MNGLLGIDVGTTGARAIVVDAADGRVVSGATSEYPLQTPRPLWAEQDADDWWRGTVGAVRGALRQARAEQGDLAIKGVGLSGQMHGVVLLDGQGKVLGPSLIWCDGRSQAECDAITERVGAARLIELVSNPALVGFSAPKLLWVRNNDPRQYEKARKFLLPKDYVRYRLTGEYATEVSDASGTLLFDVSHRRWSTEMLQLLGIDRELLPPVYESPERTGTVGEAVARELGLAAGTPVVGGGGDQAAGAVGNGVVEPGIVSSTIGSSGVVFAHTEAPARDPKGRVHSFCHAVPGRWHVMGVTQAAGLSLRWFRDALGAGADYDALTEAAARAPAGSDGLFFLPYLMGERTPHLDPKARGVWFGLTAAHTRGHLVRSILEGVAYSLRDGLEVLVQMGVPVGEVRASGGGARSALWRRIQADVFGREVVTVNAAEGPAYGAALLAGAGMGVWKGVAEACTACVRVTSRRSPDPKPADLYARGYATYRRLYASLAPIFPEIA